MIAKFSKTILFILVLALLITPFANAVVLESGLPGQAGYGPGQPLPGSIAQFINYIYLFVLGTIGIAVFASLIYWGVVWIASGIADRRGEALGKIKDAFTGLAIALGAYIILNTINPDLLKLKDLNLSPLATSTATTKDAYFWFDASSTCSSIVGATDAAKGSCQNLQCNSGACMSNDTIKCCSISKYENLNSLDLNLERQWYCTGAVPVSSEKASDLECAGIRKPFCGLLGSASCFREVKPN